MEKKYYADGEDAYGMRRQLDSFGKVRLCVLQEGDFAIFLFIYFCYLLQKLTDEDKTYAAGMA